MGIGKQAKTLTNKQIDSVLDHLGRSRAPIRNRAIFLLSVKAGLRAKEIANLRWEMVLRGDASLGDSLALPNIASKGNSGRVIPLNKDLADALQGLLTEEMERKNFSSKDFIVRTQRAERTSPQAVVNMFATWYRELGMVGCSSHSGRRTLITNIARKISTVGGSLRDVQAIAGHSSLAVTQRYIDFDTEAQKKVLNLV
jgi:integrase